MFQAKNPRKKAAYTTLCVGLSWILAWGAIPVPALAMMAESNEIEAQSDSKDDDIVVDDSASVETVGIAEDPTTAQSVGIEADDSEEQSQSIEENDDDVSLTVQSEDAISPIANDENDEDDYEGVPEEGTFVVRGSVDDCYGLSEDQLFEGYVEKRIDDTLPYETEDPFGLSEQSAGEEDLSGNALKLYNVLKPMIAEVASGTRTSTVLSIPLSSILENYDGPWNASQLGVSAVYTNGKLTQEAINAAYRKIYGNLVTNKSGEIDLTASSAAFFNPVIYALQRDCPYELYWFDKSGFIATTFTYSTARKAGQWCIGFNQAKDATIEMYVSKDYSASGGRNTTTMKSGVASSIAPALRRAQNIVAANSSKTLYEKLKAYKDQICDLVSYDMATYTSTNPAYGNSYQLISVFDGNNNTNVVCEGYAKAFKYLCDLSDIPGAECIIATGTMAGGTGAGAHMWNIVRVDYAEKGYKNYLVDVTNCDTYTIGYPEYLFLKPVTSGSYTAGYNFTFAGTTMSYKYDGDTVDIFGKKYLDLTKDAFENPSPKTSISKASVKFSGTFTYNGSVQLPDPIVTLSGVTLIQGKDYTVTYSPAQPVDAGTVTVTIKGMDSYKDSVTGSYVIAPAAVAIPAATSGLTYNGHAQTGVKAGNGYTLKGQTTATNAGTYSVTATPDKNYAWVNGSTSAETISWSIARANATITADDKAKVTGAADPKLTATVEGLVDSDWGSTTFKYTLERVAGEKVGSYDISVVGNVDQGNYKVKYVKGKFYIRSTPATDISNAEVKVLEGALEYTGKAQKADVSVKVNGKALTTSDYTVSGDTATNVGTYRVVVRGKGNYIGTATASYSITRAKIEVPTEQNGNKVTGLVYTGKQLTGIKAHAGYELGGTYTATNAGVYRATVKPLDNYCWGDGTTGTKNVDWSIARKVVTITAKDATKVYGGADPVLTAKAEGLLGSDKVTYTVTRKTGENAGTYAINVTGTTNQGNYELAFKGATFTISRKPVTAPKAVSGLVYKGRNVQQTGVPAGEGYTIIGNVASDAGKYNAVASVDANHCWTGGSTADKTISWSIASANIKSANVTLDTTEFVYDGTEKRPNVTVSLGNDVLREGVDYTLTGNVGTSAGVYTVTVKAAANSNCTGTADLKPKFTIDKAPQVLTVASSSYSKTYGNSSFKVSVTHTEGDGKLTYKSSATSVASVSTTGQVTIKGAGTAIITVTAAATKNYEATSVTTTVTVAKAKNTITASAKKSSISVAYNAKKDVSTSANVSKSNAKGSVTYRNVSTNATAKKFTVKSSTGAVTVPMGTNAGTYSVIVRATAAGDKNYKSGYKNVTYKIVITKIKNTLTTKTATKTASFTTLKSKAVVVTPITVTNAKGTVTYSKVSGDSKLSVNKSTGKITVAKGTAKGTHTATIKVSAAGDTNHNSLNKTVTVRVTVK